MGRSPVSVSVSAFESVGLVVVVGLLVDDVVLVLSRTVGRV